MVGVLVLKKYQQEKQMAVPPVTLCASKQWDTWEVEATKWIHDWQIPCVRKHCAHHSRYKQPLGQTLNIPQGWPHTRAHHSDLQMWHRWVEHSFIYMLSSCNISILCMAGLTFLQWWHMNIQQKKKKLKVIVIIMIKDLKKDLKSLNLFKAAILCRTHCFLAILKLEYIKVRKVHPTFVSLWCHKGHGDVSHVSDSTVCQIFISPYEIAL